MFEELKQRYLSTFSDKISNIESAMASSDLKALSTCVHQLAGSSGSYGFSELAHLCQTIEQSMAKKDQLNDGLLNQLTHLIDLMKKTAKDY